METFRFVSIFVFSPTKLVMTFIKSYKGNVPGNVFTSQESDRQDLCLQLLPNSHHTRTLQCLAQVVGPQKARPHGGAGGGPTGGQAPWANAQPPPKLVGRCVVVQ